MGQVGWVQMMVRTEHAITVSSHSTENLSLSAAGGGEPNLRS